MPTFTTPSMTHSRLAYTEILTDEKKETASAFWTKANAHFNRCGITVGRVLTDIGNRRETPFRSRETPFRR